MKKRYTYDPEKISEDGKDRMRFELGDTMVEGGADTSALTDEEITAVLERYPGRWKRAKLAIPQTGIGQDGRPRPPYFYAGMMQNQEAEG